MPDSSNITDKHPQLGHCAVDTIADAGVLVFQKSTEQQLTVESEVLEVFVAGDTAGNIYTALHNHPTDRPMAHDLLFAVGVAVNYYNEATQKIKMPHTCVQAIMHLSRGHHAPPFLQCPSTRPTHACAAPSPCNSR